MQSVIDKITLKLKEIETTKKELSELRDKFREQVEELESILGSVDRGIDEFDSGLRSLNDGVDALSEFV